MMMSFLLRNLSASENLFAFGMKLFGDPASVFVVVSVAMVLDSGATMDGESW